MPLQLTSEIKLKPYPFLPIRFSKALKVSSLVVNSSYQRNPKSFQLTITNRKQESSNLFACSIKNTRNAAAQAMGSNDGSLFESEAEVKNGSGRRILLSDVVVKRERNVFLGRKWNSLDVATAGVVLAMHLLSLFAPFYF